MALFNYIVQVCHIYLYFVLSLNVVHGNIDAHLNFENRFDISRIKVTLILNFKSSNFKNFPPIRALRILLQWNLDLLKGQGSQETEKIWWL